MRVLIVIITVYFSLSVSYAQDELGTYIKQIDYTELEKYKTLDYVEGVIQFSDRVFDIFTKSSNGYRKMILSNVSTGTGVFFNDSLVVHVNTLIHISDRIDTNFVDYYFLLHNPFGIYCLEEEDELNDGLVLGLTTLVNYYGNYLLLASRKGVMHKPVYRNEDFVYFLAYDDNQDLNQVWVFDCSKDSVVNKLPYEPDQILFEATFPIVREKLFNKLGKGLEDGYTKKVLSLDEKKVYVGYYTSQNKLSFITEVIYFQYQSGRFKVLREDKIIKITNPPLFHLEGIYPSTLPND